MQQKRKRTEHHSTSSNSLYMDDTLSTKQTHASNSEQLTPSSSLLSSKRAREPSAPEDYQMSQDDNVSTVANSATLYVGLKGGNANNAFPAESYRASSASSSKDSLTDPKDSFSAQPINLDSTLSTSQTPAPSDGIERFDEILDSGDAPPVASSPVPQMDPLQQWDFINNLAQSPLVEGEMWYLVEMRWWKRWELSCKRASSENLETRNLGLASVPESIGNGDLYEDQARTKLKPKLVEDGNFKLVPKRAWDALVAWHGPSKPLSRKVIKMGERNECFVEIYPPQFHLHVVSINSFNSLPSDPPVITLSLATSITEFKYTVWETLKIPSFHEYRFYRLNAKETSKTIIPSYFLRDYGELLVMDDQEKSIADIGLDTDARLAVELRDRMNDKWPLEWISPSTALIVASQHSTYGGTSFFPKGNTVPRGTTGLGNLGNTCFMNAALQCLSHTKELTQYFLDKKHYPDLNRDNPLGMRGEVAEAYGSLIDKLWSGTSSNTQPRDFKQTIGRFSRSFMGYQQHDSQELLAFLLDGLHEDLNRIIEKPYIQMPDFDGKPDAEVALKSWENHKRRNDSIIVDLFQGQFKSKLVCPDCKKISVTFDPFMYLTLPLPIQKKIKIKLIFVPYTPSIPPVRMTVSLHKDASIKHLKEKVARWMKVEDVSTLLMAEVWGHKIFKVLSNYDSASTIMPAEVIYIYQLPCPVPVAKSSRTANAASESDDPDDWIVIPIYWSSRDTPKLSSYSYNNYSYSSNFFGQPIFVALQKHDACSADIVYRRIVEQVERYTDPKLFEEIRQEQPLLIIEKTTEPNESTEEIGAVMDATPDSTEDADTAMDDATPGPATQPLDGGDLDEGDLEMTDRESTQPLEKPTNLDDPPLSPQKPVMTAASVVAAGGRQLEPLKLFTMKIFTEHRYQDSFNFGMGLSYTADLRERAASEADQRTKLARESAAAAAAVDSDEAGSPAESSVSLSSAPPSSGTPPAASQKLYCDTNEVVENAASSGNTTLSTNFRSSSPSVLAATPPPSALVIRQSEIIVMEWPEQRVSQVIDPKVWERFDEFVDPETEQEEREERELQVSGGPRKNVTLLDCLNEFSREEQLGEEDPWYCPQCKGHKQATKTLDLWKLPKVLVVHLKRFSHTRTFRDKIDALIEFPITDLDLTERVLSRKKEGERLIYDLFAVDNHFGGLGGGHYTAYAKNFETGIWYNFDDSHVVPVKVESIRTAAAYVLFYQRRPIDNLADATAPAASTLPHNETSPLDSISVTLVSLDEDQMSSANTPLRGDGGDGGGDLLESTVHELNNLSSNMSRQLETATASGRAGAGSPVGAECGSEGDERDLESESSNGSGRASKGGNEGEGKEAAEMIEIELERGRSREVDGGSQYEEME